jgi:hypothetical protein
MNVLKEIERFMTGEEEIDNKAQDAKEIQAIEAAMKERGISDWSDPEMEQVMDDLQIDSDRFMYLMGVKEKRS